MEERGANIIYLDKFVRNSNLNIAYNTYAGGTMCDYFNDYIKGTTGTIRNFKELASSDGHVQRLSGYVEACGKSIKLKSKRDEKKKIYRDYVDEYFSEYDLDVILYPTLKNKVFKYTKTGNISPGSSLGSVIGYPSITVPMGFANDGFSYGIEFLGQAYGEDKLYNVALEYEKINGNVVDTSPITPNLYEIPREVLELKDLYEQLLNSDVSVGKVKEWISLVKTFFKNYNSYENLGEEALQLINKYHELSLANVLDEDFYDKSNFFKICVIVVIVIACLIIIKNFLRCF